MQIPPPASRVTLANPGPHAPDWQVGQRLEALVLRGGPNGGLTQVRVGSLPLTLDLPAAVPAGSRIQLEVVRAGPQPILRLIAGEPAAPGTRPTAVSPTAPPPSLAGQLAVQGGQAPLLAMLSALAGDPGRAAVLPRDVQVAIQRLFLQLPTLAQAVQPEALRQAIRSSGLFYEAGLASAPPRTPASGFPGADLKAALLSLAAQLRAGTGRPHPPAGDRLATAASPPAPGTVRSTGGGATGSAANADGTSPVTATPVHPAAASIREIPPPRAGSRPVPQGRPSPEAGVPGPPLLLDALRAGSERALARLALHQWSAVESAENGIARWLLELPLRGADGIDIVHLLIERENEGSPDPGDPTWTVELALDLPELGPVHARISVSGDRIGTRLWALEPATVDRLRAALPRLRAALEERSLKVRDLGCAPGAPPELRTRVPARPLLDDRA